MNIQPQFRSDRTVCLSSFENSGDRSIHNWLRQRLEGHDRYFPIDTRVGEDPDRLVLSVLRDAGPSHPVSMSIARGLLSLLDEARTAAPQVPAFFGNLLRICQQERVSLLSSWFTEEVEYIADHSSKGLDRWGQWGTVEEILHAAVLQAPGLLTAASRDNWLRLLRQPRYSTIALYALGRLFPERLLHLNEWWKNCPEDERYRDLDEVIFTGLKTEGAEKLRSLLVFYENSFEEDLREAINDTLLQNGSMEVFSVEGSYCNSLAGVGQ